MRVYPGTNDQLPDPKIEAVEGPGTVPAYRGIAYVVFEELDLGPYGNRVPQFSFEVYRPAPKTTDTTPDPSQCIKGVALIPGTGEYALATTPVHYDLGIGEIRAANINSASGKADLVTSLDQLENELPACGTVSLVVSWFGNDLRAGHCDIAPKVEQSLVDGREMPWTVSGLSREAAANVPVDGSSPIYGGTPADRSIIEAIAEMNSRGLKVMFYPFVLMTQMHGNGLPDPWTGADNQPALPWRGRITTSIASGRPGSTDGSAGAEDEVASFFGQAQKSHFFLTTSGIGYSGPNEFSYRRFILHYAHLCASAGGVDSFCIGSELRGLTQVRGQGGRFPAVTALRELAADVRAILGQNTKIGYAADWSEYFGFQPQDGSGDVHFHLDPLWADDNIDFIGIDNYMPASDWREGYGHEDAKWGSLYNLNYLRANIAGGEGFDWYYKSEEARTAQVRTPISDAEYDEPWVFRYKDLKSWWENPHHERVGGVRLLDPTNWVPGSKPIWFTEFGCAAIDKGTNEPNKFLDPKSSESGLPRFSNGRRDDLLQMQFLRAFCSHWEDEANNPQAESFDGRMVDLSHCCAWAWDARPFPTFPNRLDAWTDGVNYGHGHWLNGRGSARSVASLVSEVCQAAQVGDYCAEEAFGIIRGYSTSTTDSARSTLQTVLLATGCQVAEREGRLIFRSRGAPPSLTLSRENMVEGRGEGDFEVVRSPEAESPGRVRLTYIDAEGDYETRATEAVFLGSGSQSTVHSEIALALVPSEGRSIVERWLAEARIAGDEAHFTLPPSASGVGAGDVVEIRDGQVGGTFRVDRVEHAGTLRIDAVRTERETYLASDAVEEAVRNRPFVPPVPVFPLFLDLPMLKADQIAHAPHLAVVAVPWPGSAAVYSSVSDDAYRLDSLIYGRATVGHFELPLHPGPVGRVDRGAVLRVRLTAGDLSSVTDAELFVGSNGAAIGDGEVWEVVQFKTATLVGPRTWELSGLLRGQVGTDSSTLSTWPVGSYFVLLNDAVRQIDHDLTSRRLARHYRIGPSQRALDHSSYQHVIRAFDGIGLRPLSPVHLREQRSEAGRHYSWVRRTRIGGDSWEFTEVPLGETYERYRVRIFKDASLVREAETGTNTWTYTTSDITLDGLSGSVEIGVSQFSDLYGAGPERRLSVDF